MPIRSKSFYFLADFTFHPMNFCEIFFDSDKTQFFFNYEFLKLSKFWFLVVDLCH